MIAGATCSKGVWHVLLLRVQDMRRALETEADLDLRADLHDERLTLLDTLSARAESQREDVANAASGTLKDCRAFLKRLASELAVSAGDRGCGFRFAVGRTRCDVCKASQYAQLVRACSSRFLTSDVQSPNAANKALEGRRTSLGAWHRGARRRRVTGLVVSPQRPPRARDDISRPIRNGPAAGWHRNPFSPGSSSDVLRQAAANR